MKIKTAIILAVVTVLSFFASCNHTDNSVFGLKYPDEYKYSVGNFTYGTGVKFIDINWVKGSITITKTENETFSVYETSDETADELKMRYLIDGEKLTIQFWKSGCTGTVDSKYKNLTVEVPYGIGLDVDSVSADVSIDEYNNGTLNVNTTTGSVYVKKAVTEDLVLNTVSGNVTVGEASANRIKIDSTSGNVSVSAKSCETAKISTVSGKIDIIKSSVKEIKTDNSSGNVYIDVTSCEKIDVDTVSGTAEIKLNGAGASVKFDTLSGKYYQSDGKYEFGNAEKVVITVNTVSGDLKIE